MVKQCYRFLVMVARLSVGCRLAPALLKKLDEMVADTGKDRSSLISEAILAMLGEEVQPVGDRLTFMDRRIDGIETRLEGLLGKLSGLGGQTVAAPAAIPAPIAIPVHVSGLPPASKPPPPLNSKKDWVSDGSARKHAADLGWVKGYGQTVEAFLNARGWRREGTANTARWFPPAG
jgi:hypothetical protein